MTGPVTDEFDDPRGPGVLSRLTGGVGQRLRARRPVLAVAAAGVLLLALGGVVWATYPAAPRDPDAVPLIRADATPYRAKPDDPGGMAIPYRDSTVFNALHTDAAPAPPGAGGAAGPAGDKVENLMAPAAEQPLPREKLFAELKTADAGGKAGSAGAAASAATPASTNAATPATAPAAASAPITPRDITADPAVKNESPPPTVQTQPAKAPATATAVKDEVAAAGADAASPPKPAVKPARAAAPASNKPAAAGAYLQLGSVGSPADAQARWKWAQGAYSQLAGLTLHVEKADLGAKGVHYRVQAGPLDSQKAKNICAAINAQKTGGCLVARH